MAFAEAWLDGQQMVLAMKFPTTATRSGHLNRLIYQVSLAVRRTTANGRGNVLTIIVLITASCVCTRSMQTKVDSLMSQAASIKLMLPTYRPARASKPVIAAAYRYHKMGLAVRAYTLDAKQSSIPD
jgi:hypothetical protein